MKQDDIYKDLAILTVVLGLLSLIAFACWEVYKNLCVHLNAKLKGIGFEMQGNTGKLCLETRPDEEYLENNRKILTQIWEQRPQPAKQRWYLKPRRRPTSS
ncbi:hypothetical protein BC937DRAFT_87880 [Endogone sp. FLAS-F59071]|nr:hypothetical protein BC937DRAFT_87880 [Endogone sp. FLAS-F59071]|eukprot:RUS19184.1 hypothetical protein BC937DRAFT_87880 [Endogone sp. FLAS-F59071]